MNNLQSDLHMGRSRGACIEDRPLLSESSNPLPSSIPVENWRKAERAARGIVWRIQPTRKSEKRRRDVVEYVQSVIRNRLCSEVFPFGSVPLKTYLPDGDIDLTAIGPSNFEENMAVNVRTILEEEHYSSGAFEVRDVQYIHAEVKLVKCLIQNIVVDISFNQMGGLCTLCFLEQVDNLIGKDHLFKRSIILIKAWCYYESRILGAHHGLISTYALETLVLYIFHFFYSSLDGPISVLYRFLDYFSKFDWDNFCISLRGPVPISSLPEILAEAPKVNEGDLLLAPEFLSRCLEMFSVPHKVSDNHRLFIKKYLNIVDPLKENNNLGRSVSKGNLYRIRSAFAYGARKLGQILLLQNECLGDELDKFFKNTLERHGDGERLDIHGEITDFPDKSLIGNNYQNGTDVSCTILDNQKSSTPSQFNDTVYEKSQNISDEPKSLLLPKEFVLEPEFKQESGPEARCHFAGHSLRPCSYARENMKDDDNLYCSTEEAKNAPATCGKFDSRETIIQYEHPTTCADSDADIVNVSRINHAPHLFFCHNNVKEIVPSGSSMNFPTRPLVCGDIVDVETNGKGLSPSASELIDLSGEHERHIRNLQYSQWCHEYYSNGHASLGKPFFIPSLLNRKQWDAVYQRDIFRNGVIHSSPVSRVLNYYQTNPNLVSGPYIMEDVRKPRGTGMYLTNMNSQMYKDAPAQGKAKNLFPVLMGPRTRSSGPSLVRSDERTEDCLEHEQVHQAQHQFNENCGSFAPPRAPDLFFKAFSQVRSNVSLSEGQDESGKFAPVSVTNSCAKPGKSEDDGKRSQVTSPAMKSLESPREQRSEKLHRLKDDDEFPPLSNRGHRNLIRSVWEVRK